MPRTSTFTFGEDITQEFNHRNNLTKIARAHELVMEVDAFTFRKMYLIILTIGL